jgi:hypothetical protein
MEVGGVTADGGTAVEAAMAGGLEPIGGQSPWPSRELMPSRALDRKPLERTCSRWVGNNKEGVVWLD